MGRSFKQRKLKKTRRLKVKSVKPATKTAKDKKKIKTWEYFLWAGAIIIAISFIIFAARTGNITPDIEPTPTVLETTE
ncbi:hypothetical protein K8T06_11205 [bacterium]|nr:hypothetical protein [bacterium]